MIQTMTNLIMRKTHQNKTRKEMIIMYLGTRDPEIRIVIPQKHCYEYNSRNGDLYIEIKIPPERYSEYASEWGSIMVKPSQVYYIPNTNCNLIILNDGAAIVNSVKNDDHTKVIKSEKLTPNQITGRELKYHDYSAHAQKQTQLIEKPSYQYFEEFIKTQTYMYDYIYNMYI